MQFCTFARILWNFLSGSGQDIRTVYKTTKVQDSFILKDHVPKTISSKIVYKFTCRSDPDINYIGFTNLIGLWANALKIMLAVLHQYRATYRLVIFVVEIDDFKIIKRCWHNAKSSIYDALEIK